jgi:uncharacterized membrane protein YphA (DoxX/SURF4 family)
MSLPNTIALTRIATSVFFLLFGEYKLISSQFARESYSQWVTGFLTQGAVGFYKPFLAFTVTHHMFFGYATGVLESAIGLSLLLGLYVRPASILGALHMLNLTLATWWQPGYGQPTWRYFGGELDHLPMLLLFLIFYSARAGETWGLDARR